MTFTELQTEVADRLNLTSSEDLARIGRAINRVYRQVTSTIGLVTARRTEVQANTTEGVQTLTFSGIEKIIAVIDRATSPDRVLQEVTYEQLQNEAATTTSPTKYAIERMGASSVTIKLNCIPQSVFALYAEGHATASTLSGSQVPAFPESYHDVLIEGVLIDEYRKLEKPSLAKTSKELFEQRLSDLRMWIAKSAYLDITQGGMRRAVQGLGGGGGGGSAPNGATSYTQTGLITFDRAGAAPNDAPFAVVADSNKVDNLDADLLDGEEGSAYHNASNLDAGTLPDARFPATLPAISGANLTNLDASDLASGTVPDARFPATLPAVSGANLTNLDASDLASGTVPDARFPATLPAISGANLTNLDASDLASGTVPVARLSAGTFTVVTSTSTGAQNNWAPGVTGNTLIEWNGASSMAATGIDGGTAGVIVIIKNITAAQVATFAHDSGSSDVDNQLQNMATSAATPVAAGGFVMYQHDGTDWKLIGHEQGAWINQAYSAGDFTASAGTWGVDSGDLTVFEYRLNGRSLTVHLEITASDVSNGASLRAVVPGGFSVSGSFTGCMQARVSDAGGAFVVGTTTVGVVNATTIAFFATIAAGTFNVTSSDNTAIQFMGTFEVS